MHGAHFVPECVEYRSLDFQVCGDALCAVLQPLQAFFVPEELLLEIRQAAVRWAVLLLTGLLQPLRDDWANVVA